MVRQVFGICSTSTYVSSCESFSSSAWSATTASLHVSFVTKKLGFLDIVLTSTLHSILNGRFSLPFMCSLGDCLSYRFCRLRPWSERKQRVENLFCMEQVRLYYVMSEKIIHHTVQFLLLYLRWKVPHNGASKKRTTLSIKLINW